jgi:hypothetical protein
MVVAVIALGALMVVAPGRMRSFDSQEESANSCFELWLDGLESLKEAPLTGLGFRQFRGRESRAPYRAQLVRALFLGAEVARLLFWMSCLYYAFKRQRPDGEQIKLEPEVERDLFGARLALGAFLAAVFFLSRT